MVGLKNSANVKQGLWKSCKFYFETNKSKDYDNLILDELCKPNK